MAKLTGNFDQMSQVNSVISIIKTVSLNEKRPNQLIKKLMKSNLAVVFLGNSKDLVAWLCENDKGHPKTK